MLKKLKGSRFTMFFDPSSPPRDSKMDDINSKNETEHF